MELKFNKNGDAWVAEFEATDKFNLHMEGLLLGSFSILQRTAGGNYTHVRDIPTYPRFDKVFDYDFDALVYPKFIKIVSETKPTYAEVVSDGEITEIKSQTKEVEVTANGTTQVAPDAGYSYLTGVTVKTNVPQSGGSGGSEGGGSNWRYFRINDDFADNSISKAMAFGLFHICRYQLEGQTIFGNIAVYVEQFETTNLSNAYAVAVDADVKFFTNQGETYSFNEAEMMLGGVGNLSLTEITKEEFYTI